MQKNFNLRVTLMKQHEIPQMKYKIPTHTRNCLLVGTEFTQAVK